MATETIHPTTAGQEPITFRKGGLHRSTGTPAGEPISAKTHAAAASGKLGALAEKQERFRRNVLTGPKGRRATGKR